MRSVAISRVVGGLWYHLSEHIVDVLCTALARLSNPRIRHLVIQTAYEELGEQNPDAIHTDLLRQTLSVAGVQPQHILALSGHRRICKLHEDMLARLDAMRSDAPIAGLLLGMEVVAYENIDLVVEYLGYTERVRAAVADTPWVGMHHQLEEHHIARATSVFVDFVHEPAAQRMFVRSFVETMDFWREFWSLIAEEALATTNAGPELSCAGASRSSPRRAACFGRPRRPCSRACAPHPAVLSFHPYAKGSADWVEYLPLVARGFTVAALDVRASLPC